MSKSLARVEAALRDAGLDAEIREMGDTRTALDAATAVGCEVDQIAKSIIFRGEDSGHVVLFLTDIAAFIDPRLLEFSTVWAAAGTPRHVFAIAPDDLVRVSGARPADFTA